MIKKLNCAIKEKKKLKDDEGKKDGRLKENLR